MTERAQMLENPEQFAKTFKALVARVGHQEKLIAENTEKTVHLEARVKVLESGQKDGK